MFGTDLGLWLDIWFLQVTRRFQKAVAVNMKSSSVEHIFALDRIFGYGRSQQPPKKVALAITKFLGLDDILVFARIFCFGKLATWFPKCPL